MDIIIPGLPACANPERFVRGGLTLTKGYCSHSDVNVRAQLLRKNYSRNFSSIRSGPLLSSRYATSRRVQELVGDLF